MRTIMGIQITDREENAKRVQELLTEHGCSIKTRLGLHEAVNVCSTAGLIIVEFVPGKEEDIVALEKELATLEGVKVQKMEF